jgi:uncharacterized membrane protein YbhN (UPF0104 family)
VVFVALTLYHLGAKFDASEVSLTLWPLGVLTLILVLGNYAQAVAWQRLLERLVHRRLPGRPLYSVYMAGQLARYTPGKVALLVVRVTGAKRLGLGARLLASSVGIEVLSWMVVGLLLGTATLACSGAQLNGIGLLLSRYSLPLALAIVLTILFLLTVDRRRFPAFVLKVIKAEGEGPILSLSVLGWQALSWLGCVAQALLLPIAVGAELGQGLSTVGIFILAPIAGFLAMVAPGGLGVREAVLSFALSPVLGPSRALLVALLARCAYVASEILAWAVARSMDREPRANP